MYGLLGLERHVQVGRNKKSIQQKVASDIMSRSLWDEGGLQVEMFKDGSNDSD